MLATKDKVGLMDKRISFYEEIKEINAVFNTKDLLRYRKIAASPDVWAEITSNGKGVFGNETYEADQLVAVTPVNFRIRYRTDITVQNYIVSNNILHEILSIKETVRGRYMEVRTEEKGVGQLDPDSSGFTLGFNEGYR